MSLWRRVLSCVVPSVLVSALVGMSAAPVSAGTKTYLSLWQRCTATAGAASMSAERPPILYPFSGEQEARRYTTCYQGQRGWGSINGGAANYCNSFNLASYQVGCFGGTVSAPAFFVSGPPAPRCAWPRAAA